MVLHHMITEHLNVPIVSIGMQMIKCDKIPIYPDSLYTHLLEEVVYGLYCRIMLGFNV